MLYLYLKFFFKKTPVQISLSVNIPLGAKFQNISFLHLGNFIRKHTEQSTSAVP